MSTKTRTVQVRTDSTAGRVTALVSCFGNVDLMGDRVMPGAFADDLDEWIFARAPIPMIFTHDWGNLDAHIGGWDPLLSHETAKGLELTGTLDLDDPPSAKVFRLLERGTLREFSFAYDIIEERRAPDGANELLKLHIIEAGPTLKGANPDTELVSLKSAFGERQRQPIESGDFRSHLEQKFAADLVAVVYGDDPASRAAQAAVARSAAAKIHIDEICRDLTVSGTLPSEAERDARIRDAAVDERRRGAARDAERDEQIAQKEAAAEQRRASRTARVGKHGGEFNPGTGMWSD